MMSRRWMVALLALAAAAAQACVPAGPPPAEAPGTAVEADEREVWRAVIAAELAQDPADAGRVLSESTILESEISMAEDWEFLRGLRRQVPEEALRELIRRSASPAALPAALGDVPGVRWITGAQREEVFRRDSPVSPNERLSAQLPGAATIYAFSRVGFDRRRTRAAVLVETWCGMLCGRGRVLLLERDGKGGWKVADVAPVWIS